MKEPLMSEVINNSYTQKNFFPIDGRENITESLDQLDVFEEFSNFIDEDSLFREQESYNNAHRVIAFLVEAIKQLYKDDWKKELWEIKNKINAIRTNPDSMVDPDNSYRETTWFLNKIFLNLYKMAVVSNALNANKEHNPSEEKFYLQIFNNIEMLQKFEDFAIKNHRPIPLGGVHERFVPGWLKEHGSKHTSSRSNKILN